MRDIALSGFMFILLMMGSGSWSLDSKVLTNGVNTEDADWDKLGLLLRLSLAAPLIIGGLFGGYASIATFATYQPLSLILGLLLVVGIRTRDASVVANLTHRKFSYKERAMHSEKHNSGSVT